MTLNNEESVFRGGLFVGGIIGFSLSIFTFAIIHTIERNEMKAHAVKIGNARYNEVTGAYEHIPHIMKAENE